MVATSATRPVLHNEYTFLSDHPLVATGVSARERHLRQSVIRSHAARSAHKALRAVDISSQEQTSTSNAFLPRRKKHVITWKANTSKRRSADWSQSTSEQKVTIHEKKPNGDRSRPPHSESRDGLPFEGECTMQGDNPNWGFFGDSVSSHSSLRYSAAIQDLIGDPFSTFCVSIDKTQVKHLHHFFHVILPSNKSAQASLWPLYHVLLIDEAALSAVLAKSMLHRWMNHKQALVNSNYSEVDCLQLKTTALNYMGHTTRMISARLTGSNPASDATLLAVLELVCCYTSAILGDEVLPHILGILQLLELREGLKGVAPFFAYRAIMADNVVAAMTGRKPLMQSSCVEDDNSKVRSLELSRPSRETMRVNFATLQAAFASDSFTTHLAARVLLIERKLLYDYYNEEMAIVARSPHRIDAICQSRVSQSTRLAFVIYMELNTANTWRYSAVVGALVTRLKQNLELTPLRLLWIPYSDALLLVLLLGGVGAIGHPERPWFVGMLRTVAEALALHDFQEAICELELLHNLVGNTSHLMRELWMEAVDIV